MTDLRLVLRLAKALANLIALGLALPLALTCWLEERLRRGSEDVFRFWNNALAVLPGGPGVYVRRAFYHLTLTKCSLNCWIGFGALFSHRTAEVADEVYIGPYAVIGSARLETGCLIGTRASLLSGLAQHERRPDGRWAPAGTMGFQQITVGSHAWVGEAAVVMADVGAGALVGAGSVVSSPVPPGVVVAGNPARFVRDSQAGVASTDAQPAEPTLEPAAFIGVVDWFKCLGMLVIVYGHLVGWGPLASLPPIYSKQLGVALFLFIAGYSLSQETRERHRVLFNRLFEVYVWAGALALSLSVFTYLSEGRLQLSNYAPLAGGINVVFNFFPANPTTWYLGTYLHILLLWALVLYRVQVSLQVLLGSLVIEVLARAFLIEAAGRFVAYMALTNWSTVFLLGLWYGQQRRRAWTNALPDYAAVAAGLALIALLVGWTRVSAQVPFQLAFPFMSLSVPNPTAGLLMTSAAVSAAYLSVTWLAFHAIAPFPAPRPVRFVARNTLIIFLGHMPVLFALTPLLSRLELSRGLLSVVLTTICLPGLGMLSEVLRRTLQMRRLRDRVYRRLSGWREPLVAARP